MAQPSHVATPAPCQNCTFVYEGNYCPECGEKRFHPHDRSVLHFAEEAVHLFTHFEGSFFRTIKTVVRHPGLYSADFAAGRRKSYFKPLSLFLLVVIAYLFFPLASGLVMPLKTYLASGDLYGEVSRNMVAGYQQRHPGVGIDELSVLFHQKINGTAKFTLLLLLPVTGLFLYLFFFWRRSYLYDHLVFATEWNTVFLLINFFAGPLVYMAIFMLVKLFIPGLRSSGDDTLFTIVCLLVSGAWLVRGLRRFYNLKYLMALPVSVVLLSGYSILVYTFYKTLLFWLVFRSLH